MDILSQKQVWTTFKKLKTKVELQHGLPIKVFQFDLRGEFRPFNKYLSELGIVQSVICPHTHHQNDVIERKHKHIVDMGFTILSQASLPLTYWILQAEFNALIHNNTWTFVSYPLKDKSLVTDGSLELKRILMRRDTQ